MYPPEAQGYEEIYYSYFQIAEIYKLLNESENIIVDAYYDANNYLINLKKQPRAEPFYELGLYYRSNNYKKAIYYLSKATKIPLSQYILFVNKNVYSWRAKYELVLT